MSNSGGVEQVVREAMVLGFAEGACFGGPRTSAELEERYPKDSAVVYSVLRSAQSNRDLYPALCRLADEIEAATAQTPASGTGSKSSSSSSSPPASPPGSTSSPSSSSSSPRCSGSGGPKQVIVDFLSAWRFCPVSEASNPSLVCLEDAAGQLLDALASTQPNHHPDQEVRERLLFNLKFDKEPYTLVQVEEAFDAAYPNQSSEGERDA